jgi:DNA/RNA endonuclease G (NUC1)
MRKRFAAALGAVLLAAAFPFEAPAAPPWKPGAKNRPAACGVLWRGIGLPRHISTGRSVTFVCHRRYVLLHDNVNKTPDWVIERLKRRTTLIKGVKRPSDLRFVAEQHVPPAGQARDADYRRPKANLDRGHMAPAEDFNVSLSLMKESFILSNAVPQVGDRFNGSIWKELESEVRRIARHHGDIYVVTGPVRRSAGGDELVISASENSCGNRIELKGPHPRERFICAAASGRPDVFCEKGVAVPIGLFKIIYVRKTRTAYAFVMPNVDHDPGSDQTAYLDRFRVSIAALEKATRLQFFRDLTGQHIGIGSDCAGDRPWVSTP